MDRDEYLQKRAAELREEDGQVTRELLGVLHLGRRRLVLKLCRGRAGAFVSVAVWAPGGPGGEAPRLVERGRADLVRLGEIDALIEKLREARTRLAAEQAAPKETPR